MSGADCASTTYGHGHKVDRVGVPVVVEKESKPVVYANVGSVQLLGYGSNICAA